MKIIKKKDKVVFAIILFTFLFVLISILFSKYKIIKLSTTKNYTVFRKNNYVLVKKTLFPKRNDLIVYVIEDKYFVSRCVALPKDTVYCVNGKVFINKKRLNDKDFAQNIYRIIYYGEEQKDLIESNYQIIEQQDNLNLKYVSITEKEKKQIENYKLQITNSQIPSKFRNSEVFPKSFRYDWNENNYGPLVLPKTKDILVLNEQTYSLWKNTILEFEKKQIERKKDNSIFVNTKKTGHYIFENNYYYVLNDQRWQLSDSRKFGPIAENCIIGKIIAIF